MAPNSKKSYYVQKNQRLALYRTRATADYWDNEWLSRSENELKKALRPKSFMASHAPFFNKWLPRGEVILEAGCGTGIWVQRFRERGYNCIGLDYAVQTLLRTKRFVPRLPFLGGDIFSLPFANGSIGALVSFGVVEHFVEGPSQALREFSRILKPGGIALISVPYKSPLRFSKIKTVDEGFAETEGAEFYQYYFKPEDFFIQLQESNLSPNTKSIHYYGVHIGLREQSKIIKRVIETLPIKSVWTPILDFLPLLPYHWGHMMFAVCKKM